LPATHALIAFDAASGVRWTRTQQCWGCGQTHGTFAEYVDDAGHRYPDSGSAWFSSDGTVVWAHVRERDAEWWLVLDATTGQELARVDTESAAAGSQPVPHPDGRQVGLSIGEGQDGSPLIWADWDGAHLTASRLGDEHILVAAGGPGFVAVHHARRRELSVHRAPGGEVVGTLFAEGDLRWDFGTGFVAADTYVTSTSLRGHGATDIAHHLIDTRLLESVAVTYPEPVAASPVGLGDDTWVTVAPGDPGQITRWRRIAA